MRISRIYLIVFFIALSSCNMNSNKLENYLVDSESIIASYYLNDNADTIEFIRVLKKPLNYQILTGKVMTGQQVLTRQVINFIETVEIDNFHLDSIESKFNQKGFRNEFDSYRKVMFVQLHPKVDHDLKALNIRHRIERKINRILRENNVGEFSAGDLGPGGANMLFSVDNWEKAFELTMKLLEEEELLEQTLISKRLYLSENDWNYEIVYPFDYDGEFNSY